MNVEKEIAALAKRTARQPRRRHVALFGEEARPDNRQWLLRRIAWRMQALHEGDLSERARRLAALSPRAARTARQRRATGVGLAIEQL